MSSLISHQPIKAVYVLFATAIESVKLPFWILKYAIPSLRQQKGWTFRNALMLTIMKRFLHHISTVDVQVPLTLSPGAEKERFITIAPAAPTFYVGPLEDPKVKPATIGATWYPAALTAYDAGKAAVEQPLVILHIHGGAFITGDGRARDTGFAAKTLLKHTPATHILCPAYRLASRPDPYPFPAALQDSVSSYIYLTQTLGIPASRIVVSGDSAGGNLVLGLLRYINEHGSELDIPTPRAAWLWSPWCNPASALDPNNLLRNPNYPSDFLAPAFGAAGARRYSQGHDPTSPFISPLRHAFKPGCPVWVSIGGAEVLAGECVEIVETFKAQGVDVESHVEKTAPHDVILVGQLLGMQDTAVRQAKAAGEWLDGVLKA